jgi:hypothetical protein
VTRRSARVTRGSDGKGSRRRHFDDAVLAVCFLALVGVVILAGVLMLLSWITTMLPTSPMVVCPEFDGCAMPTPNEEQGVWVDDPRIDQPTMIP